MMPPLSTLAASLLDGLFGLDGLGFGDEAVRLELTRSVPAWIWVLVAGACIGLAAWSYRRLTGPVWARSGLAALRALVLMLLAVLAAGPRLARPNERIERDWVIVLVDRSASLTIRDVARATTPNNTAPTNTALSDRSSRDEQLKAALTQAWPQLDAMAQRRHVLWMGFGGGAFDLPILRDADGTTRLELGDPDERRTALGAALDQALARTSGRRVSGVVVIGDGRSVDEPSRAALRRLEAQRIRVLTIALGSDEPIADLALHLVEAPDEAFARDPVPIRVVVDRLGAGQGDGGEVRLIDADSGAVLDRHTIVPGPAGRFEATLLTTPAQADQARWRVELVPAGVDLVSSNNTSDLLETTISDRPLRVVYFDGYPRWEYRYVKNLLMRERSIRSSAMLLAANRRYLQEGDVPLVSVPRSPEEWAPLDVVVVGDVRAEVLSDRQREQLLDHVASRGGGVLMIAGPGAMPSSYRSTVLGDLLPFTADTNESSSARPAAVWDERVTVYPSPQADRLGVLRLDDPDARGDPSSPPTRVSDPSAGWTQLRWAQRIDPARLKPTAEVLAWVAPAAAYRSSTGGGDIPASATPLVITMRYGAGRVLYVATDEIWRWRYGKGEALPERFWIPLIRLLGRQSLARSGLAATIEATPTTAQVDQPISLTVRLLNQSLVDAQLGTIRVRLDRLDDPAATSIDLELARDRTTASAASVVAYATTWRVPTPGRYRAMVVDPSLASLGLAVQLRVLVEDDEMRHPQADHAALAQLARAGDGQGVALDPSRLGSAPGLLPVREVRIESPPDQATLWDRPIVLIVLLLLLTAEWIGRKLVSLS